MAWVKRHATKDGRTRFYVKWRSPETGDTEHVPGGFSTFEEADEVRLRVERDKEHRQPTGERTPTRKALDGFYASRRANLCVEDTIQFYAGKLEAFAKDLEPTPLHAWTRVHFEEYIAKRVAGDNGWSRGSVSSLVRSCRTFIGWAQDAGLDVPDFVGRYRIPKREGVAERRAMPPKELAAVLATAARPRHLHLEPAVGLATYTSMPIGDIRTLDWSEVDLERGWIDRAKGRRKTGARVHVPIVPELKAILERHRATHGLVCRDLPTTDTGIHKALRALFSDAGLPAQRGRGFHALRHAYATILAANGADLATIRALLGHGADSSVTLRYVHTDDARLRAAAEGVARTIAEAATA